MISIHALREESDAACGDAEEKAQGFQSTPSARRATDGLRSNLQTQLISIHALREESDGDQLLRHDCRIYFNPRPPRGERHSHFESQAVFLLFQSTPSARRATLFDMLVPFAALISIHALREESDAGVQAYESTHTDFNPRPPRGERPRLHRRPCRLSLFQSTPSARRATAWKARAKWQFLISIHALREESDQRYLLKREPQPRFQSTPSARRATTPWNRHSRYCQDFNPRPPRGERLAKRGFA